MNRNELNKLYNADRIRLTSDAVFAINLGMQTWSKNHPWATPEQHNKALRRKTVDLCLDCPNCFTIV